MTTPATQLKLGLLALVAIVAGAAVALALGLHERAPTVRYHTYVDESVQGLEVGSAVVFRGVRVGNVGAIAVAPDRTHIDVALDLAVPRLAEIDVAHLVATLGSAGITGVKFVELAPRRPGETPQQLAFEPAARTIPARRSLLASLEERATRLVDQMSQLVDRATVAVDKLGDAAGELRDQHLAARFGATLDRADVVLDDAHRFARGLEPVPAEVSSTIGHVDAAAAQLRDAIGRLDTGDELSQTIRDVGDAARSVRDFIDDLAREPDILLKGRSRGGR